MADNKDKSIEILTELLELLQTSKKRLKAAYNWGIADILTGGFILCFIKHQALKVAKQYFTRVNDKIDELKEKNIEFENVKYAKISLKHSLLMFDFWVTGNIGWFISMEVQDKIKREIIGVNSKIVYLSQKLKDLKRV
jgi:hypothetical protein